jgi:hypothetical protein
MRVVFTEAGLAGNARINASRAPSDRFDYPHLRPARLA